MILGLLSGPRVMRAARDTSSGCALAAEARLFSLMPSTVSTMPTINRTILAMMSFMLSFLSNRWSINYFSSKPLPRHDAEHKNSQEAQNFQDAQHDAGDGMSQAAGFGVLVCIDHADDTEDDRHEGR